MIEPRDAIASTNKQRIVSFVKKVGCIQYDPLNIIDYNTNLVLQSRITGYKKRYLSELLYSDRKLIDGWDKNMSVYPIDDWPYFQRLRDEA